MAEMDCGTRQCRSARLPSSRVAKVLRLGANQQRLHHLPLRGVRRQVELVAARCRGRELHPAPGMGPGSVAGDLHLAGQARAAGAEAQQGAALQHVHLFEARLEPILLLGPHVRERQALPQRVQRDVGLAGHRGLELVAVPEHHHRVRHVAEQALADGRNLPVVRAHARAAREFDVLPPVREPHARIPPPRAELDFNRGLADRQCEVEA
mmetsp:Transcript_12405/g.31127  ORF Transcript_12405/g.31127 Transcript_12405/m.31127 type:complete len:209 (-) Transcript_12405:6422-7048(-)